MTLSTKALDKLKPPIARASRKKSPITQVQQERRQQSVNSQRSQKVEKVVAKQTQTETERHSLTNRKIDLLAANRHLQLKLKLQKKKTRSLRQKLSKLMFFFYTLQKDKNIPVNQIYEEEGIRQIPTNRFNQILGQIDTSFQPFESQSEEDEFSFYSSDSYELCQIKIERKIPKARSSLINSLVPKLDLTNLPQY